MRNNSKYTRGYMSGVMYVAISVVLSVGIILAYNYFTNSNTPPTTSASSSDLPADVPIGTMVPYAGKDIPAGWLACDNTSYPITTYPELFAKIGYTYGMDDTKYRVPDTRGVFMRGIDATATRDANRPAGSIQLSGTVPDTNSIFTGASATATGGVGYVPAPMAGQQNLYLRGDGTWSTIYMGVSVQNNLTGIRKFNTVYQNTTGKPMFVSVTSSTGSILVYSGGSSAPTDEIVSAATTDSPGVYPRVVFWVLPNNYYRVFSFVQGRIVAWVEWS